MEINILDHIEVVSDKFHEQNSADMSRFSALKLTQSCGARSTRSGQASRPRDGLIVWKKTDAGHHPHFLLHIKPYQHQPTTAELPV